MCSVDAGGKLVLPRFVRDTLSLRSNAATILVGAHESDPCLVAYDPGFARQLAADAERRHVSNMDARCRMLLSQL